LDLRRTGWQEVIVTDETLNEAEIIVAALRLAGTMTANDKVICSTHGKGRAFPPGCPQTA